MFSDKRAHTLSTQIKDHIGIRDIRVVWFFCLTEKFWFDLSSIHKFNLSLLPRKRLSVRSRTHVVFYSINTKKNESVDFFLACFLNKEEKRKEKMVRAHALCAFEKSTGKNHWLFAGTIVLFMYAIVHTFALNPMRINLNNKLKTEWRQRILKKLFNKRNSYAPRPVQRYRDIFFLSY